MKRRRRTPLPRQAVQPIVEEDEATGSTVVPSAGDTEQKYANLRMPHERDERTHAPVRPGAVTTQAADDLAEGRRETDLYSKVGADFDRKARRS
jgi:hypothetical protein